MGAKEEPTAVRASREGAFIAALCPLREKVRRCYDQELFTFGLSRALAGPLMRIWQHDGLRQNALAELMDVEGPSLVRILDQLGASGLVVRRSDPADLRARTLHVTEAGAALAQRIDPLVDGLRNRLLAGISDADLETCVRVFDSFLAACERESNKCAK